MTLAYLLLLFLKRKKKHAELFPSFQEKHLSKKNLFRLFEIDRFFSFFAFFLLSPNSKSISKKGLTLQDDMFFSYAKQRRKQNNTLRTLFLIIFCCNRTDNKKIKTLP